jgi:hypothetical protein
MGYPRVPCERFAVFILTPVFKKCPVSEAGSVRFGSVAKADQDPFADALKSMAIR